jgi:methionine synthase reductase
MTGTAAFRPVTATAKTAEFAPLTNKVPVYIFPRPSHDFHLPDDPMRPVILIGPGTGVAPFIGFLQHRMALKRSGTPVGPAWLLYGFRHEEHDMFFTDVLRQSLDDQVLTKLILACSRQRLNGALAAFPNHDDSVVCRRHEHRYVQHALTTYETQLMDMMMDHDAVLYICGYVPILYGILIISGTQREWPKTFTARWRN